MEVTVEKKVYVPKAGGRIIKKILIKSNNRRKHTYICRSVIINTVLRYLYLDYKFPQHQTN